MLPTFYARRAVFADLTDACQFANAVALAGIDEAKYISAEGFGRHVVEYYPKTIEEAKKAEALRSEFIKHQ